MSIYDDVPEIKAKVREYLEAMQSDGNGLSEGKVVASISKITVLNNQRLIRLAGLATDDLAAIACAAMIYLDKNPAHDGSGDEFRVENNVRGAFSPSAQQVVVDTMREIDSPGIVVAFPKPSMAATILGTSDEMPAGISREFFMSAEQVRALGFDQPLKIARRPKRKGSGNNGPQT